MRFLRYVFVLLALCGFLTSCSPVKRVLSDPKKFEQVAVEVVKRGYCVNDTIVETVLRDTTIVSYIPLTREIHVPATPFELDTLLPGNIHLVVKDDMFRITTPIEHKQQTRTILKTQTVRDTKLESILKYEIETLTSTNDIKDKEIKILDDERKLLLKKYSQKSTLLGVAALAIVLLVLLMLTKAIKT